MSAPESQARCPRCKMLQSACDAQRIDTPDPFGGDQMAEYAASLAHDYEVWHQRALAAETALASARPVLDAVTEYIRALRSDDPKDDDVHAGALEAAYDAWLTSHPSPAPCSGCAAAREFLQGLVANKLLGAGDMADAIEDWLKEHAHG